MPFSDTLSLLKISLREDVATLNSAHSTNMDTLSNYFTSLITFVNELETTVSALPSISDIITKYNYTLDVTSTNGVTSSEADGSSITRDNLVFTIVHISDLTNAMFQIMDNVGRVITSDMSKIQVNTSAPTNLTVELPTTFSSNLKLIIIN
tara:strand:- start:810 stop:1262 length:453 start_codon:yes stop_codon:yes gene_type:complete